MKQLIVFLKNPKLGRAKTRLASTIGDDLALAAYRKMCDHTIRMVSSFHAEVSIYWSDSLPERLDERMDGFRQNVQHQGGLGTRMMDAIQREVSHGPVAIIGSDCLDLSAEILKEAYDRLALHDVVLGPAADGGYYLLAMKEMHPELFLETYSHGRVLRETVDRAAEKGLKVSLLSELSDIDTWNDLERYLRSIDVDLETWLERE